MIFLYFYIRYVSNVNAFCTTALDLSFDGHEQTLAILQNVPTFLNLSQGWVEIIGYWLWVRFVLNVIKNVAYEVS